VHSPLFFTEETVAGDSFPDILENWLLPQINTNYDDYIIQLDEALTLSHTNVRALLSRVLPQSWIERATNEEDNLLPWPPRSPDLTPCDFFLCGFLKDSVYVPPLPSTIQELRGRITHALQAMTADMLHRVWDESDYRVDVCRVTQGAHIEVLNYGNEKLVLTAYFVLYLYIYIYIYIQGILRRMVWFQKL
jgi:hypothetical protein